MEIKMLNQFSRTQLLLGESAMQELANKRVAVFGIGGVGGYACEALVRSGIGAFDLIDDDKVCLTNLNRQIIATRKTVGKYKYYFSHFTQFYYDKTRIFMENKLFFFFKYHKLFEIPMRFL